MLRPRLLAEAHSTPSWPFFAVLFEPLAPLELAPLLPGEPERVVFRDSVGLWLRWPGRSGRFTDHFAASSLPLGPILGTAWDSDHRPPKVGIEGNADQGVEADPDSLRAGAGCGIEGFGKSE